MADTEFRRALSRQESTDNYDVVNSEGYTGAYQFGPKRLEDFSKAIGREISMDQFRQNPELQEQAQRWHEQDVLQYVTDTGLDTFVGQEVAGVKVTPSSLIAMAHLGGNYGMRQFLESGGEYDPSDSNGTKISDYGKMFSGMNVENVNPSGRSPIPRARPDGLTVPAEAEDPQMEAIRKLLAGKNKSEGIQSLAMGQLTNAIAPAEAVQLEAPKMQAGRKTSWADRLGITSLWGN
jgi:hypothetical protein